MKDVIPALRSFVGACVEERVFAQTVGVMVTRPGAVGKPPSEKVIHTHALGLVAERIPQIADSQQTTFRPNLPTRVLHFIYYLLFVLTYLLLLTLHLAR
jgi:hypothetical protein